MMIIHNLSGGDVTKYEQVFQEAWANCHMARKINLQTSIFQKRLNEIMKNKR